MNFKFVFKPSSFRKTLKVSGVLIALSISISQAQVAINTDNSSPHSSAMLEVKATGMGLLAPRMTFAQRPASPATGLLIYQTNSGPGFYYYDGTTWQKVGLAADSHWLKDGSEIYYNAGKVSIGMTTAQDNGLSVQNYVSGKAAIRGTNQSGSNIFAEGMLGVLNPSLLGVPTTVFNAGVIGIKPAVGLNGAGVLGWNNDVNSLNYAGYFVADGTGTGATNYGVFAEAKNNDANFAGFFKGRVSVESNITGADATSTLFRVEVKHSNNTHTYGIYGKSAPANGFGYGVTGEGGNTGVTGFGVGGSTTGTVYGVYGYATGTAGTRVGVYGFAFGGATNWAGYFAGSTYVSSDLRVGTTTLPSGYKLAVNGKVIATEVRIEPFSTWPDYVFDEDYYLMNLSDLEKQINENKHLPGIPSAREVAEGGFDLGDMQKRLLEKVEELTLYTIQQQKEISQQEERIVELLHRIEEIDNRLISN
jgi:hypothetical protein